MVTSLTCVIPTHGRPRSLGEAIRSVAEQTMPVAETLVVTDVGDEPTHATVAELRADGVPVRLIDRSAEGCPGASRSRNVGASNATTDLVAFLDDDDRWRPTFAEETVRAMQETHAPLAVTAKLIVRPGHRRDGDVVPIAPDLTADRFLAGRRFAAGGNIVMTRDVARSFGPYDERFVACNDLDLFCRLLNDGVPYAVVERPLVEFRAHDGPRLSRSDAVASQIRQLLDAHRAHLGLRARRRLSYKAAAWERRRATTSREALEASLRMAWNLPVEWLVDGEALAILRSRLPRRTSG